MTKEVGQLEREGAVEVSCGECGAVAQVDDPLAGVDAAAQLVGVDRFGWRQVDGRGSLAVDDAHVGVVGRVGRQSGDEFVDVGLLVLGQCRVVGALFGDGGGVAAAGCGRAEAAESVGGIDLGVVGEFVGEAAHRVELGVGQVVGVFVAEQVGASGGAVQHGPAGENADCRARSSSCRT